jgi:alanine dehydrogenase
MALTNATLPYVLKLAKWGHVEALRQDVGLRNGLNVCLGQVTNQAVAQDLGYDYVSAEAALGIA